MKNLALWRILMRFNDDSCTVIVAYFLEANLFMLMAVASDSIRIDKINNICETVFETNISAKL